MDQWPGYESDRRRVLRYLADRKIANPVVLTGDIHSNWANELSASFDGTKPAPVAAEFVGTSISSGGDGKAVPADHESVLAENPGTKFFNTQRGYVHCEITPKSWTTDYQVLDYVSRPAPPSSPPPVSRWKQVARIWSAPEEPIPAREPSHFTGPR
jgi:alkaline phosphatase D